MILGSFSTQRKWKGILHPTAVVEWAKMIFIFSNWLFSGTPVQVDIVNLTTGDPVPYANCNQLL